NPAPLRGAYHTAIPRRHGGIPPETVPELPNFRTIRPPNYRDTAVHPTQPAPEPPTRRRAAERRSPEPKHHPRAITPPRPQHKPQQPHRARNGGEGQSFGAAPNDLPAII